MSKISIIWGTTPKKKNLNDAGLYPHLNTPEQFTADFWLDSNAQMGLEDLAGNWNEYKNLPSDIIGYQIIRGAFHGFYTRIRPLMENWGVDYVEEYNLLLDLIAQATGWHHVQIDGANAVVKQDPEQYGESNTTWKRWKANNPSFHLREASKKNWEVYHEFLGDLDEVGEWDDDLFIPQEWEANFQKLIRRRKN